MKELTFKSYLKNYLKDISGLDTLDISRLINLVQAGNTKVKDPLLLYCIMCGKTVTLRNVLRRENISNFEIGTDYITEKDLKSDKLDIKKSYKEIYQKYLEEKNAGIISHERKENLRKQIIKLNKKHNLSIRRLSVVAGTDASNFNTFMKNKDYPKVSTERLEKVVAFLEEI